MADELRSLGSSMHVEAPETIISEIKYAKPTSVATASDRNVVTVLDAGKPINKAFNLKSGVLTKSMPQDSGRFTATMVDASTREAFKAVLEQVSSSETKLLMLSGFQELEVGEPFQIVREAYIEEHTGKLGRAHTRGVHLIDGSKTVGRFKENVFASHWVLLDRDIDQYTPAEFGSDLDFDGWMDQLAKLLPGVNLIDGLRAKSSSSLVHRDGAAVGGGNGHTYVRVRDPERLRQVASKLPFIALQKGLGWQKPKHSRKDPSVIVGYSTATLVDCSVWNPGRIIFAGKPTVQGAGLTVADQEITTLSGLIDGDLDLSAVDFEIDTRLIRERTGMSVSLTDSGAMYAHTLELGTELELQDGRVITVAEFMAEHAEATEGMKVRCQAPFRDSSSWNAFAAFGGDGKPFVFDNGTGVTYWLRTEDWVGADFEDVTPEEVREQQRRERKALRDLSSGNDIPTAERLRLDGALSRFVFLTNSKSVFDRLSPRRVMKLDSFDATYKGSKMAKEVPARGISTRVVQVAVTNVWVEHQERKTAHGVTFRPGYAEFTDDPKGVPCMNTWRPFDREGDVSDVSLFIDHVRYLFGGRMDDFLDWLAHIEQHPGELPHTGWLHISPRTGTGRNWMATLLCHVWSGYVAADLDLGRILGDSFNDELSESLLAVVNECREAGSDRHRQANRLRSEVNPTLRNINKKFGLKSVEWNCCRWLLLSNHLQAIPIDQDERRFEIVINDEPPHDAAYYQRLYDALKDSSFILGVARYLGSRDIRGRNIAGRTAQLTEDKSRAMSASRSDLDVMVEHVRDIWPSDVILNRDLAIQLHPDWVGFSSPSIGPAERNALIDYGCEAVKGTLKFEGRTERAWVLRNVTRWRGAEPYELVGEISRGRVFDETF